MVRAQRAQVQRAARHDWGVIERMHLPDPWGVSFRGTARRMHPAGTIMVIGIKLVSYEHGSGRTSGLGSANVLILSPEVFDQDDSSKTPDVLTCDLDLIQIPTAWNWGHTTTLGTVAI